METNNLSQALTFARNAHGSINQKRKYTGEDYIFHPIEVAFIVASTQCHTTEMLMAALLHDTVEDTPVTIEEVRTNFGDHVADLVGWLTDVATPEDGNRAARKALNRAHSMEAPAEAQTVKVADIISNVRSIAEHDKDFARVYLPEKQLLLDGLIKADATLRAHAYEALHQGWLLVTGCEGNDNETLVAD